MTNDGLRITHYELRNTQHSITKTEVLSLKLHQLLSYGLMTAGSALTVGSLARRRQWEQANNRVAVMLDWDDVQAVATRATLPGARDVPALLAQYRANGATHLSIPELTLNRLLAAGDLSVIQGRNPDRVYLQARNTALAGRLVAEFQARLPHVDAQPSVECIFHLGGDLPTLAEVGLGFDPAHAELARQAGLLPVPRPVGYSWIQPEMIERTLAQAAALDAKIIAVQGALVPGHEFNIQYTVEAMRRHRLTFAYFRESRHQKGDWFMAKHLAGDGLVLLAHEFTPADLLDEDLHTAAYRWGNLALEAGVRLVSLRFFRVLHAADPLESLDYVHHVHHALAHAGFTPMDAAPPDLTAVQPPRDKLALAAAGLSTAGAVGLATDLLPLPDWLKTVKVAGAALALGGLPLLKFSGSNGHQHHHAEHGHSHHHHSHNHDHHHGPAPATTAYAQKGLALAATAVFPAATAAITGPNAAGVLAQSALVTAAGAAAVSATTVDPDYLLGVEEYRGWNLDWLFSLGLVAAASVFNGNTQPATRNTQQVLRWLPIAVVGLAGLSIAGKLPADLPASLDREHRHSHTHHLSALQQQLGDAKMALSPRPLRKWSLLTPLGAVGAALLRQIGRPDLAPLARWAAVEGQVATLTGFRQGQRPLAVTARGRARSWLLGAGLAAALWAAVIKFKRCD